MRSSGTVRSLDEAVKEAQIEYELTRNIELEFPTLMKNLGPDSDLASIGLAISSSLINDAEGNDAAMMVITFPYPGPVVGLDLDGVVLDEVHGEPVNPEHQKDWNELVSNFESWYNVNTSKGTHLVGLLKEGVTPNNFMGNPLLDPKHVMFSEMRQKWRLRVSHGVKPGSKYGDLQMGAMYGSLNSKLNGIRDFHWFLIRHFCGVKLSIVPNPF